MMVDYLIHIDQQLFLFVNKGLSNAFFDAIFPYWRHRFFWIPLYILVIYFLAKTYGKKGWLMVLALVLTFAVSDAVNSHILKQIFHRVRPCNDVLMQQLGNFLVPCGGGFSFPSSHATNHFAFSACLSSIVERNNKWIWLGSMLWSFSIIFGQVYVGVHYPIDVFVGAMEGLLIGLGVAFLFRKKVLYRWNFGK